MMLNLWVVRFDDQETKKMMVHTKAVVKKVRECITPLAFRVAEVSLRLTTNGLQAVATRFGDLHADVVKSHIHLAWSQTRHNPCDCGVESLDEPHDLGCAVFNKLGKE